MPDGNTVRRTGTARLGYEENMKDVSDVCDAVQNVEIVPQGAGTWTLNGGKVVLDLSQSLGNNPQELVAFVMINSQRFNVTFVIKELEEVTE